MILKTLCEVCDKETHFSELFSHYDNTYFLNDEIFRLIRCENCDLVTIENKPSALDSEKYYQSDYYSYDTSSNIFSKLKESLSKLASLIPGTLFAEKVLFNSLYQKVAHPNSYALDLGCGDGSALATLKKLGFIELYGTEIDKEQCARLAQNGITSYCTNNVTTLDLANKKFDLIRISHVLEHLHNPRSTLKFLHGKLKDSGTMMIGVPNFDSIISKIFGRYFCGLQLPTHLYHFNKKNLRELLESEYYKIIKLKTTGFSGISYSLLTILKDKFRIKDVPQIFSIAIILLFLPLEIILTLTGQGYIINLQAEKVEQEQ